MVNISPKLFQKAIQKGLKTALFTTSTAALMFSSSGGYLVLQGKWWGLLVFDTGAGLDGGGVFATGSTLQYTTNDTVNANLAVNITAIDVDGNAPALFTVNENISLGSVGINGGTAFPVSISDTFTLTLTGADGLGQGADTYTGLGAITLNGAAAGLTINSATPALITLVGTIDGGAVGQGILQVSTDTTFNAAIGATKSLASITFGAVVVDAISIAATNIITNGGGVDVAGTVNGAINIAGVGGNFNVVGLVTGTAIFNANGKLTLGNGISADITAAGNNGNLVVSGGNVQNIGANGNSVFSVTFNNTAASTAGSIFATKAIVNSATANVTTGTVNGAISFAAAGKLKANGLVTGAAEFDADGTLTLGNGITGDVTTTDGDQGTVIITGGNNVQNLGVGDELKEVIFNNGNNNGGNGVTALDIAATTITIGEDAGSNASIVTAEQIEGAINFANAGQLKANGLVTGTAEFNANGTLTLGNGITGAITAAGNGVNGTVIVTEGNIGNVGADGNSIRQLTFNNTAASNAGNIFATNVTVNNAGTNVTTGAINGAINFKAAGKLTAEGKVTGTAVFTTDGTLNLTAGITGGDITAAGNGVNGTVIVTNGDITNVGAGGALVKQLTFNNSRASGAGNIFATNVTVNSADANVTATGTVTGAIAFCRGRSIKCYRSGYRYGSI